MNNPLIEMLQGEKKPTSSFTGQAVTHLHEYYIVGTISEATAYTEWFNQIRHAPSSDAIKIYINSTGGDLWAAIQWMRVLKECQATVSVSVEGACMSAATIVFLMCDNFEISPHSMFMFHNYSGGAVGKGGEMIDQIKHERKWSEKLLLDIYKNFLNKNEVEAILNNKDIWMTGEEVVTRLNFRKKILDKMNRDAVKKSLKK